MLSNLFQGIFDEGTTSANTLGNFLICIIVSLLIGFFLTFVYSYKSKCTKSFMVTLALLPAMVCAVIMMVNGNVGTGVAVAGTFSLVRFRSAPGTAKDIGTIFLAMGAGLIAGMGYVGYAVLFTLILGLIMILLVHINFGENKMAEQERILRITIPEDLDYIDVFDDVFEEYTESCETVSVKTTNMGSMFKLQYNITLKDSAKEKNFMDELRCRNGNLEVSMSRQEVATNEL